jgi:hypothetical protein
VRVWTWGDGWYVGCGTYQSAGGVDACVADGGVVQPFGLGEPEEPVAGDVHGGWFVCVFDGVSWGPGGVW